MSLPYILTDPTKEAAELVEHNARVVTLPDVEKLVATVIEHEGKSMTVTGVEIDGRKIIVSLSTSWGSRHNLGYRIAPTLRQIETGAKAAIEAHIAAEAEEDYTELRVRVRRDNADAVASAISLVANVEGVGD